MKKLLILPVVILTMLVCFIPITASADDEEDYASAFASLVENDTFNKGCYLYCKSGSTYFFVRGSQYFVLPQSQTDGVYSWHSQSGYRGNTIYRSLNYHMSNADNAAVVDVTYDDNLHTLSLVDTSIGNWQNTYYDIELLGLIYNNEVIYGGEDDSMDVSVVVNPELSGSFNRTSILPTNGVAMTQEWFNFEIENHSRFGVQWLFAIVEEGSAIPWKVLNLYDRGIDCIEHSDDVKYVYYANEECYILQGLGFYTTAVLTSPMHYTAPNSDSGQYTIKWDMMNLQKNHNYDVVVYAVQNDSGLTSWVQNSMRFNVELGGEVNYEDSVEVYRSTFSIENPAVYDSNSSINGAPANDSNTDFDALANTMYSYADVYSDSEVKYGTFDYRYDIQGNDKELSYIDNYSSNGNKFQSLMRNTSSVFSFYAGVLKFFPSDWLSMYQLGIFSIIVIAIIRRLT